MNEFRFLPEYIVPCRGNIVACEEYGKKLSLDCNGETFFKIIIDGGAELCNSTNRRCDFMIINDDESIEIYVELKGQDIVHAANQIIETIKKYGLDQAIKYSVIVTSSIPRNNTALQNVKLLLKKQTATIPFIKNRFIQLKYKEQKIEKTN